MAHTADRATPPGRTIPSLDGLRAVSIGLVLLSHYAGTRGAPIPVSIHDWVDWGKLGVRVFFVISGFLITHLLLTTGDLSKPVDLRTFYWRRAMRIFPPYYAYLAAVVLLGALGWIAMPEGAITGGAITRAAVYLTNYGPSTGYYVGHSWSLAVEEQFYLLWPAAMLLVGRRRAWIVALLVVVACPLIRVAEYHLLGTDTGINRRFETVADALAMGCLLAYGRDWLGGSAFYARVRESGALYLLPLVAAGGSALGNHPHAEYVVGIPAANVAIALLVDWTVREPGTAIGRVLNTAAFTAVGRMSYSIYLWQQLFLYRYAESWMTASPVNVLLAVGAGWLSYVSIEQPWLRLRNWLEARVRGRQPTPEARIDESARGDDRRAREAA